MRLVDGHGQEEKVVAAGLILGSPAKVHRTGNRVIFEGTYNGLARLIRGTNGRRRLTG